MLQLIKRKNAFLFVNLELNENQVLLGEQRIKLSIRIMLQYILDCFARRVEKLAQAKSFPLHILLHLLKDVSEMDCRIYMVKLFLR